MLSKAIIISLITVNSVACVACSDKTVNLGAKANYHSASKELLHKIEKSLDRAEISAAAKKVADLATPVLTELVAKNKKCSEIASFIQKKKLSMYDLKPSQLEADYHDGGALPTFPDECHDLKELIVHPATVVSLAKYAPELTKVKAQMKDEIEEVILHFEAL